MAPGRNTNQGPLGPKSEALTTAQVSPIMDHLVNMLMPKHLFKSKFGSVGHLAIWIRVML